MKITVTPEKKYAFYDGIGASGAWWSQAVGAWDDIDSVTGLPVRDAVMQLLYDKKNGIGLDIYRYNIGGGSAQSGKGNYSHPWRRTESFVTPDGKTDYTADKNAVYMMKKASELGAELTLFVNSPPEAMTKNGLAHCSKIMRTNLAPKKYSAFADYCLDVAEHFIGEGLNVRYISPVNEPLWVWTGGQEGCHYSPLQARRVLECFASRMNERPALKDVRLTGAENGDIRWLNKCYTAAVLGSKTIRTRCDSIDVHSYFLKAVVPLFRNRPDYLKRFRKFVEVFYPDAKINMSEWCHMKGGRDYGMDSALETAKVMCEDFSILNVSSWQHWIACSCYDYCDGLIYLDEENKTYSLTKRYWVTGNFSKFIPRGARRIEAVSDCTGVLCLAFEGSGKRVVIAVNLSENDEEITAEKDCDLFLTSAECNLAENRASKGEKIKLPARSVITIISEEKSE